MKQEARADMAMAMGTFPWNIGNSNINLNVGSIHTIPGNIGNGNEKSSDALFQRLPVNMRIRMSPSGNSQIQ